MLFSLGPWGGKCQLVGDSCISWHSASAECQKLSVFNCPKQGLLGICSFPGQGAIICQGFRCFLWWGLAQVHVEEETCSPRLFFCAAAPDFAPRGTSLPPQPRRASRYCSVGYASLQLPLAPQSVPYCLAAGLGFSN